MPTLETHNGYPLWHYIPSLPAAIVFAVLFGAATFLHNYLMATRRTWFCIPFIVGGVFEIIGYVGRALAYNATGELIPYILQSIFLLLAPILFAASLYMTLSRVIFAVRGEKYSFVPARWITRIFVFGDVFSFLIQGSGAGLLVKADTKSETNTGQNVIIAGLIFQVVIFGIFCLTALVFNVKFRRHGQLRRARNVPWQGILIMLYVTSAFIMGRNIFRVIEYAMGQDGYLLEHEWSVYVFDGVLMLFTMLFFAYKYPSRLNRAKREEADTASELGQM
ncbi:RTA1 like protein [Pleurostoma richardsiae]|uniref:RTA1 like protein n=1 Tax=Pleurostoma richardsiae TaxID=41990 RepID=A0AA38RMR7_9PEZI|nr:RTA1 like protein [Pleurostoma richardsiae]